MFGKRGKRTILEALGIQRYFGVLFLGLFLAAGLALTIVGHRMLAQATSEDITHRSEVIARTVRARTVNMVRRQSLPVIRLLSMGTLPGAKSLRERLVLLPVLQTMLKDAPALRSIFIGYESGDYMIVAQLRDHTAARLGDLPPGTSLAVLAAAGDVRPLVVECIFFNDKLEELGRRNLEFMQNYDPRERAWYQVARQSEGPLEPVPFMQDIMGDAVIAFARKSRDGQAVVGATVLVAKIRDVLREELPSPDSYLALFRPSGELIAGSDGSADRDGGQRIRTLDSLARPVLAGREMFLRGVRGDGIPFTVSGRDWVLFLDEVHLDPHAAGDFLVLAVPRDVLLRDADNFLRNVLLVMAGILLFACPLVWLAARRIARPLHALALQASRFYGGNPALFERVPSELSEIRKISSSISSMQAKLRKVIEVIGVIGVEKDFSRLIGRVLQDTVTVAQVDGGLVVLLNQEGQYSKNGYYFWGGHGDVLLTSLEFSDDGRIGGPEWAIHLALAQERAVLDKVGRAEPDADVDFMSAGFEDANVVHVQRVWVALRDRAGTPLGAISFFRRAGWGDTGIPSEQVELLESLARAIGLVLEMQHLLKGQRDLRDALIHILAGAIDAKSPYTGGHCARVPAIFQMLLQAACDAREGPLADFHLDKNGWEEARLAAWLHDCGKVTTPEYVMDKATKLETLNDRIHEVRTRFEVLKRDAEIIYWRRTSAGADRSVAARLLEKELQTLDEEFAFVASCNLGVEQMNTDALARLHAIGRRTWMRTLDKRLGVSREERARMDRAEAPLPPVVEPLLADNPEQIIPRSLKDRLPADNPWGFQVTAPEALYNRGELHNLSISHGTLTPEERYKINDHITQTIMMLSRMPLPKELAAVPEIAGAHHETMDGRGYPRRLVREEMSWKARMMAVADIFEALTAGDRPYKTGKTLSEALDIMDKMHKNGQIDSDIYALFLRSGIPERYAAEYLSGAQNDLREYPEWKPQEGSVALVAV